MGMVVSALVISGMGASAQPATAVISVSSPCAKRTFRHYSHVVVIAFENQSYKSILGSSAPPSYFKTLASTCGSASNFSAVSFPRSLPDYLAVTSGTTSGITSDCVPGPACSTSARSIFQQVGGSHWSSWGESMPSPCYAQNRGLFVPRHLPALYFTRISHATCVADVRPLPSTPPSGSRRFVWVAPNLNNDMHNGTPAQASAWLKTFLAGPQGLLRRSTYQAGHMAIFIWFDTAGGSNSMATPVPLLVVAPSVGHRLVSTHLTDYNLLHGWQGMLGVPCLANSCRVSGFDRLFGL